MPGAMDEQAELKKSTDRILVVIPTYDEIENLSLLVDEIFSLVPQVEILIVDDNEFNIHALKLLLKTVQF